MLHIGGWFDIFGIGTVRNFRGISNEGNHEQHLIMGPWAHTNYDRWLGELEFGPDRRSGRGECDRGHQCLPRSTSEGPRSRIVERALVPDGRERVAHRGIVASAQCRGTDALPRFSRRRQLALWRWPPDA